MVIRLMLLLAVLIQLETSFSQQRKIVNVKWNDVIGGNTKSNKSALAYPRASFEVNFPLKHSLIFKNFFSTWHWTTRHSIMVYCETY